MTSGSTTTISFHPLLSFRTWILWCTKGSRKFSNVTVILKSWVVWRRFETSNGFGYERVSGICRRVAWYWCQRRHKGKPWRGRQHVLLKRRYICTRLYRVTPQNAAAIFICWSPVFIFRFLRSFISILSGSCIPPSSISPLPVIVLSLLSPTSSLHLSDNFPHSFLSFLLLLSWFFTPDQVTLLSPFILHSPFSSSPHFTPLPVSYSSISLIFLSPPPCFSSQISVSLACSGLKTCLFFIFYTTLYLT